VTLGTKLPSITSICKKCIEVLSNDDTVEPSNERSVAMIEGDSNTVSVKFFDIKAKHLYLFFITHDIYSRIACTVEYAINVVTRFQLL